MWSPRVVVAPFEQEKQDVVWMVTSQPNLIDSDEKRTSMEGGVEFYWRREEHFNGGGGHLWWRFIVLIESKNSKVWVCWQQEQWLVPFSSTAVRSTTSYEGLSSMHSSMPLGCRSAGPSCGSGNVLLTCGWCARTPILTIRAYPCTVQCLKVVALVLVVLGMVNSLVIGAPQQYLWWIFCWWICIYVHCEQTPKRKWSLAFDLWRPLDWIELIRFLNI